MPAGVGTVSSLAKTSHMETHMTPLNRAEVMILRRQFPPESAKIVAVAKRKTAVAG